MPDVYCSDVSIWFVAEIQPPESWKEGQRGVYDSVCPLRDIESATKRKKTKQ